MWIALTNNLKLFLSVPVMTFLSLLVAVIPFNGIAGWRFYRSIVFVPFILAIPVVGIVFTYILQLNGVLNTALMGECWHGTGKNYKNILFIKHGDDLACRSMIDGVLISGTNGAAGEIGYYLPDTNSVRESFYYPGVAESKLSRDIFNKYYEKIGLKKKEEKSGLLYLLEKANEGDKIAEEIVIEIIDDISIIINNTSLVLDPEVIILGGKQPIFVIVI